MDSQELEKMAMECVKAYAEKYLTFHQFKTEEGAYGSFEIFKKDNSFFWWACFPGCLPDGEPEGPFETEEDAYQDAQDYAQGGN